jgi:hypothetical protein
VKPGGIIVIGLYNRIARLPLRLRRGIARLTNYRWIPFDPVLRDRKAEPARREAWLAQLGWMRSLGGEGGLFVTVGRRPG